MSHWSSGQTVPTSHVQVREVNECTLNEFTIAVRVTLSIKLRKCHLHLLL